MTTGKTIALTRWTFVGKLISLLFNMLSRLVIAFLPRSKHFLISWLQSPSAVNFVPPPKNKVCYCFHCLPSICYEVMGLDAMILATFIKRLFSSSLRSAIGLSISISHVIDISPSNLDSSLCFIQPSISHDVFCIYKNSSLFFFLTTVSTSDPTKKNNYVQSVIL